MSKVICDVCGTTFPETAEKCPICGCAKSPLAQTVASDDVTTSTEGTVARSYVKGGRFSKANVKRNNNARTPERHPVEERSERRPVQERTQRRRDDRKNQEQQQESNKGLIAVVVVLLLAIVMVVVYIGVTVFLNGLTNDPDQNSTKPSTEATQNSTDDTGSQTIPCTDLAWGSLVVELTAENEQYLLEVRTTPEDTTEEVSFVSNDENVAIVDQNGLIIPIGHGQTTITVTCGQITKECTVICTFGEPGPSTGPTGPVATAPAGFVLELNRKDFTLSQEGESWRLFKDTDQVKASDITWTVDDPGIATVKDGVVVGVDRGVTTVTAILGDQSVTCIVRCSFDAAGNNNTAGVSISHTDVTLKAGESFTLILKNADGSKVQGIEWTVSEENAVEIDGNRITAAQLTEKKTVEVSVEHEGVTYTCTVRVYPKQDET